MDTAIVRCEEGWDDVKSARPLRPGPHTCYNGGYSRSQPGDGTPILKAPLSSDWSLQPDSTKLDSLVIAHQPWRGEYVPGPLSRNKVAVPEGAAGTPPFWSGCILKLQGSCLASFLYLFVEICRSRVCAVPGFSRHCGIRQGYFRQSYSSVG